MSNKAVTLPKYSSVRHSSMPEPYIMPSIVTQEIFDDAISYQASPGDIFICTFPKSGTSWMQTALTCMRREGKPLEQGKFVLHESPFLETTGKSVLENWEQMPRIIKTHLYHKLVPWHDEAKYIFIARNPKDCFASFYHHTVGFEALFDFRDGTFEDFFELVIKGANEFGDYFKYVPEWWEQSKAKPNILMILYEDMKEDMGRELLKIVDFIGSGWSEKIRANDNDLLKKMLKECDFNKMKQRKDMFPSDEEILYRPEHLPFIRKGIVGDWKNIFTEDQSRRVDERMKEAGMKHPGFDHIWDKYSDQL